YLLLDRLHRFSRQRILQHSPDLGEIVAQRLDRFVHAAGLELLDLGIHLAQLLLEAGEVLGTRTGQRFRERWRSGWSGGRVAIEGALPICDLPERLIQRGGRLGWGAGRSRRFALKIGYGGTQRIHPSLDLSSAGALLRNQLIEPAVEL